MGTTRTRLVDDESSGGDVYATSLGTGNMDNDLRDRTCYPVGEITVVTDL
jgi:hypothetical protein